MVCEIREYITSLADAGLHVVKIN